MSNTPNILLLVKRLKEFELKFKDVCVFPTLREGERYAGIVLNEEGEPSYHLVVYEQMYDAFSKNETNVPTPSEALIISATLAMNQISRSHWTGKSFKDGPEVRLLANDCRLFASVAEFRCLLLRVRRVPV